MTRINCVPVTELCDQHLLAEFRELTRIPNCLLSGKLKYHYPDRPTKYTLGPGHVKFFTNKLQYLYIRYGELYAECLNRRFSVSYIFPVWDFSKDWKDAFNNWEPTQEDMALNRARIQERMPAKPRWTVVGISLDM